MKRRSSAWLLLLGIAWPVPLALAQGPGPGGVSAEKRERSHKSVGGTDRAAAEKMLKQRLGRHHDLREAQELIEDLRGNPGRYQLDEDLLNLLKEACSTADPGSIAIDPETLRLFQEWAAEQKRRAGEPGRLDAGRLDSLERVLRERQRENPFFRPFDPERASRPPPSPRGSPSERQATPPVAARAGEPDREVKFREGLVKYAERYLGRSGRASTALRRAEEELIGQRSGRLEEWLPLGAGKEGLRSRLPQLDRSLRLDRFIKDVEWPFRIRPGSRDIGGGWRSTASPDLDPSPGGLPAVATPDADASGWQALLWLGLGAVLVVVFGKLLGSLRDRAVDGRQDGFRLGRWPVNPAAVATREELVRAFEYLSLLRLGPVARSWNHLEIAGRLGDGVAAARLAGFYERARYAPPEEPLPDAELAEARRHLCFLAGVSAS